jgi:hypothetical protein
MIPDESAQPKASAPPPASTGARSPWVLPLTVLILVLIPVAAGVYVFRSCRNLPGETLDKTTRLVSTVGQELKNVAAAFSQGTVTTTFTSYATEMSGSQRLQIATLNQHETFTRKDESSTGFGYIPLPEIIVQATAPVTYTYYLDLNERWDFVLQNGTILVTAPDLQYNKPAVDVSGITFEVKKDSVFRSTSSAMENLKNSITWLSYKKAEANLALVRDTGRRQTELFIERWVRRGFTDGKDYPVKVRFRSELGTNGVPKLLVPPG